MKLSIGLKPRYLTLTILLWFQTSWAMSEEVYYCNATATTMILFHETAGFPIYTQKMDPYPETLKFKRERSKITVKTKYEKTMKIHDNVYPRTNATELLALLVDLE